MKFLDSKGLDILWKKIKSSFLSLNGGGQDSVSIYGYDRISIKKYDADSGIPLIPCVDIINGKDNDHQDDVIAVNGSDDRYCIGLNIETYPKVFLGYKGVRYYDSTQGYPHKDKTWDKILDTAEALTTEELNEVLV